MLVQIAGAEALTLDAFPRHKQRPSLVHITIFSACVTSLSSVRSEGFELPSLAQSSLPAMIIT